MDGNEDLVAVILAAGKGKRMRSDLAKVLHRISGRPMIRYVLEAARSAGPGRVVIVVGHQADSVMEELAGEAVEFVTQEEQLGTGHAVMQAKPLLEDLDGTVMVLTGDTPLLKGETLEALVRRHRGSGAAGTVLSAVLEDATGYGRIIKDSGGALLRIVEHRDADEEEKKVREINSGIFCFESGPLFEALGRVGKDNTQGEYYLTDVMAIMREEGLRTVVQPCADSREVMGINDAEQLKEAERVIELDG